MARDAPGQVRMVEPFGPTRVDGTNIATHDPVGQFPLQLEAAGLLLDMLTPTPFRVSVPDSVIEDLHRRLGNSRFPDDSLNPQAGGNTWQYGMPNRVAKRVVDYWLAHYQWRNWEAKINSFPQFMIDVAVPVGAKPGDTRGNGSVKVHFIHEKSTRKDAVPLVLLHGWPGSFVEFLHVIRPLTDPPAGSPAFHVVVPSLVGFGFSTAAPVRDFGIVQQAAVMDTVMRTLGYPSYVAQGGDFGSHIAKALALYHDGCKAIHLNMPTFPKPPPEAKVAPPTAAEAQRMAKAADKTFVAERTGYQAIQSTKPQTLAYGIGDSPVGLMAWIGEKFHEWVDLRDGDGDFSPAISLDHFLTNVTIYWITNTAAPSFRMYMVQLLRRVDAGKLHYGRVMKPVGVAAFPFEGVPPRSWADYWYAGGVRWTVFDKGGHFAAMERPEDLVGDVRAFVATKSVQAALAREAGKL